MTPSIPSFDSLPLDQSGGPYNAWGLYGKNDELGFLNRLSDNVVKEAAKEIRTGTRISLNWPLDAQGDIPFFGRQVFHKHIYQKPPRVVNDDVWTFNTQSSSQWDGLRHFAYQAEQRFYNGVTLDDIHGPEKTNVLGIGAMSEQGIVGRGILVDYWAWLNHGPGKGKVEAHDAFGQGAMKLEHIKDVLEWEGVVPRFGDVLLVRSGFIAQYNDALATNKDKIKAHAAKTPPDFFGVEQSEDVLRWIWDNFAAVAGDQPSFECWPTQQKYMLHEILLAGWGCPIGELFDLEKLSAQCAATGRYTFFVTSEPVNVPGGVASPPNILAIF